MFRRIEQRRYRGMATTLCRLQVGESYGSTVGEDIEAMAEQVRNVGPTRHDVCAVH